jgi:hypothetical protein
MKKGVSYYKKKLDKLFSEYIRRRGADSTGMTQCFTCGVKKHWKELQCGHFCPRQYLSLRYDETNCQTQCYACNMLYNGQPSAFAIRLKIKYGDDIVESLEKRRQEITRYFPYELKLEEYKNKLKDLS